LPGGGGGEVSGAYDGNSGMRRTPSAQLMTAGELAASQGNGAPGEPPPLARALLRASLC
jgi:hypothetical protein